MGGFIWTNHALDRLRERFPNASTEIIYRAIKVSQRGDWTTYVNMEHGARLIVSGVTVVTVMEHGITGLPEASRKTNKRLVKGIIESRDVVRKESRFQNRRRQEAPRRSQKPKFRVGQWADIAEDQ